VVLAVQSFGVPFDWFFRSCQEHQVITGCLHRDGRVLSPGNEGRDLARMHGKPTLGRSGIQALFGRQMSDVKKIKKKNAEMFNGDPTLQCSIRLANYCVSAGALWLLPPRVLAE